MVSSALLGFGLEEEVIGYADANDCVAAKFEGLPLNCMDLSSDMVGKCGVASRTAPKACGDACLKYSDLTTEQLAQLTSVLTVA